MDLLDITLLFLFFLVFAIFLLTKKPNFGNGISPKLPPGPKPIRVVGNILEVGEKPHESLAKLSKTYGPLMSLKLGSITTIVVSSPNIAKILFQKHDQIISARGYRDSIRALDHDKASVAWMPVNNNWRKLRRICKEQMFSTTRLDANQAWRIEKLQNLWDYINKNCISGQVVDIGAAAFTTSLNLMSATLFSTDFAEIGSDSSTEFKENVCGIMELAGKPNFSDYFSVLQLVDPQGILRKMTKHLKKCFNIFDEIINERVKTRVTDSDSKNDMLEALLAIKQNRESELSFDEIKHLLLDLFVAGTDTSSGTVEWTMTELMRNPEKMIKAKTELRTIIKQNERVQESDISRLPYLRAVIKETFRLHPTLPFLLPHKATKDVEINGYIIPKDAEILVNVWAMGRDSTVWSNPELFMPERFLEQEIEFRGQHFELIPFGAGRRTCVGLPLAYRMVHLMVATLIHNFDWKLEQGIEASEIDVRERFGLSLQKLIPFKAIPSLSCH